MKFFKTGLVLTALSFFVFACSQTPTGSNSTVSNNTSAVINTGSTNANSAPNTTSTNTQNAGSNDELAAARKIFQQKCIRCHKEDGTGGETDIEGKKIKAPNFTTDRMKKEPDAEFIEIIENGEKDEGMPSFKGKLTDEEIKNMVKLIRHDFQGQK